VALDFDDLQRVKCHPVPPSPAAHDEDAQRRLWDVSRALTGLG